MAGSILIIDDDRDINEILGQLLKLGGFEYIKAETGREGIALVQSKHPDVVILDMMLPDLDGYQICRQITSSRATGCIPVLMLTCMCQQSDQVEGISSGAFRHLAKPFSPETVLTHIREALTWKRQQSDRPLSSHFELSSSDLIVSLKAINQMICDLVSLSPMDDVGLGEIRSAFGHLMKWFMPELPADAVPPHQPLHVDYQIKIPGVGEAIPADSDYGIYWKFTDPLPDLLQCKEKPSPGKRRPLLRRSDRRTVQRMAESAAVRRQWDTFLMLGGMTQIETQSQAGMVDVMRRFRPANRLTPRDGTVWPLNRAVVEDPFRKIKS